MRNFNTKQLVLMALMIALDIVLTRFLSIQTPIIRIGFGFLPVALVAMVYGPVSAAIVAVLADVIGVSFFSGLTLFPGFTLSAALVGIIYGVFMYKRVGSTFHICAAVFTISIFISLGLNTFWIHMMTGNPYFVILSTRLVGQAVMVPIQIITIKTFATVLRSHGSMLIGSRA